MDTSKKATFKPLGLTVMNAASHANLESFTCLWLDQNIYTTLDNRTTEKELRQVINHLRTFDDSNQCEEYIQKIEQEKVILIVSGSLGQQIVPRLHSLPQFAACYVFCHDKVKNEQWTNSYHKVKGVFDLRSELVRGIAQDQELRIKMEVGAAISIISHNAKSRQDHSGIFIWFQLFIEVLLRMHHKSSDRRELIHMCKKTYQGNEQEMSIIEDFEKNYKPDDAIRWYTKEACFYRIMNKALRVRDYDMLFRLRFFLTDIAKQLKNEHEKLLWESRNREKFIVYRGQGIEVNDLELMKNSIGDYLSLNSFLSTSRNIATAMNFVRSIPTDDERRRILFEITIDPRKKTCAFADVKGMSYHENEDEILIMLGALFRIDEVIENKTKRIWISRITLAKEDDYHSQETFTYMKEKIGDDTNLDSLGKILTQMGEYEHAKKYYQRMMEESQVAISDAQAGFGWIDFECKEYESSLEHHKQALNIRKQCLGEYNILVGSSYRQIASAYSGQGKYDEALKNLKKSVQILENTSPLDFTQLARTYLNIAVTYDKLQQSNLALEYYNKAIKVQENNLPPTHPEMAQTFYILGCFYRDHGHLSKALEYFEKSLHISKRILPPTHQEIIRTKNNIKKIKEKLKQ